MMKTKFRIALAIGGVLMLCFGFYIATLPYSMTETVSFDGDDYGANGSRVDIAANIFWDKMDDSDGCELIITILPYGGSRYSVVIGYFDFANNSFYCQRIYNTSSMISYTNDWNTIYVTNEVGVRYNIFVYTVSTCY